MERLKIIALLGKARSGKDTVGKMLCDGRNGVAIAFADKLKAIASEMFDLPLEALYSDEGKLNPTRFDCLMCPQCKSVEARIITLDRVKHGECKVCGTVGAEAVFKSKWTNRTILQYLGTEGFRRIDPEVWVRYALNVARSHLRPLPTVPAGTSVAMYPGGNDFVVITDCRFRSEAKAVWAAGGEVWRIKRPETDKKAEGLQGHASETELETIPDSECQAVINNDSTLDALRAAVHVQFERFKRE